MKPFGARKTIMDGVEDARADVSAAAHSLRAAAVAAMLAFALISVVALVALARTNTR